MPRPKRGVFAEDEYNGHVVVTVWFSSGDRLRSVYPAWLLDNDEIVRLHRLLDARDPIITPLDAAPPLRLVESA